MENSHTMCRIIELDNVRQNNIVLIDLSNTLSESIFEQEYQKAASIIRKIILDHGAMENTEDSRCRNCESKECTHCRFHDGMLSQRVGVSRPNLTKYQTAVPFIGDRGTGKTSVMCSILERLKNYRGDDKDAAFNLGLDLSNSRFVTFDMIDANTLKKTDDVMEIILSRMLTYLENLQSGGEFRELYRQIDELHEDLCLVDKGKVGKREEYGLTGLQYVANSQNAVENFRKLVSEFNQTISRYKFHSHPCYLVVALDDIDMYRGSDGGMQDSQFALLEHIYNHMRIPGLIVLMTYNELILKRTCNRHFESIYFGKQKPDKYSKIDREAISTLTRQFLSKLFPHERRIYMPNYTLINSAESSNLFVRPVLYERNDIKVLTPFAKDEIVSIKEFMLRLIAHRTGVYFDATGSKKHFFEPRNLRELGELFQIVYSLEEIPENADLQESTRSRNRQAILNYLYNQFAVQHLDSEEYEQFRKLSVLPFARQSKLLIDMIHQQRLKVAVREDDIGYLSNTRDQWKYSYGELLHNIYLSTRIARENSTDTYFSKAFVHCILGTYSMLLCESIYASNSPQYFLSQLGPSITGCWANEMLPDLRMVGNDRSFGGGSISLPIRDYFNWMIPEEIQTVLLHLYISRTKADKQKLRTFLEALILIGMLFTRFPATGLGIVLDADLNEKEQANLYLRSNSEGHICFNIMNFVINLNDFSKSEDGKICHRYFDYIQVKLEKLGNELLNNLNADWKSEKKIAEVSEENLKKSTSNPSVSFKDPLLSFELHRNLDEAKRAVKRATAWIAVLEKSRLVRVNTSRQNAFIKCWNEILQSIICDYKQIITEWLDNHGECHTILPVQNFDMMYNIIKRLADRSYRDIPKDTQASEIYNYYVCLYKDLERELCEQDKVYFGDDANGFAAAFSDSLFFKIVTAQKGEEKYNPYIESVLVSMIRSTAGAQIERKSKGRI